MLLFGLIKRFLALRRNVFRSRAEIKHLQNRRLQELLTYAYDHSDFYRRRFDEAGIRKEQIGQLPLSRYPVMDKADLMAHFDELVTAEQLTQADLRAFDQQTDAGTKLFRGSYHVVHSSGSTGKPHYFVYDEDAWNEMLSGIVRGALWGMSLPDVIKLLVSRPRILYVAATDGRYGGALAVGDGIDGVGAKQLFLDVNTPLNEWAQKIKAFDPNMVIGYPTAIKIMAEMAQYGQIAPHIKRIVSCGEPLTPGMRSFLETALQTEVVNFYGASESLALGVEGPNSLDIQRLKAAALQDKALWAYTFNRDNGSNPAIQYARNYAAHWSVMREKGTGLLLWGGVGSGKTFAAACIAHAVMEQGYPVLMTNFGKILNSLSGMFSENRNQYLASLNEFDLLIIDDLGVERNSEYALEQVYNVVDSRYLSRLPFIITTNLALRDMKKPNDIAHARIYDRVLERCTPIFFSDRNYRKDNAARNKSETARFLAD